jgi:Lrp/AsnC family leucine-responsive transcriptional regulator
MEIDQADRKLLNLVQENARLSNQELAERAGLSSSACWRRMKTLEEAGVIAGYSALVDAGEDGPALPGDRPCLLDAA